MLVCCVIGVVGMLIAVVCGGDDDDDDDDDVCLLQSHFHTMSHTSHAHTPTHTHPTNQHHPTTPSSQPTLNPLTEPPPPINPLDLQYHVLWCTGPLTGTTTLVSRAQLLRPKGPLTRPMLKAWLHEVAQQEIVQGVKGMTLWCVAVCACGVYCVCMRMVCICGACVYA